MYHRFSQCKPLPEVVVDCAASVDGSLRSDKGSSPSTESCVPTEFGSRYLASSERWRIAGDLSALEGVL